MKQNSPYEYQNNVVYFHYPNVNYGDIVKAIYFHIWVMVCFTFVDPRASLGSPTPNISQIDLYDVDDENEIRKWNPIIIMSQHISPPQ